MTGDEGTISELSFHNCFEELARELAYGDEDDLRVALGGLYGIFDANGDGVVDFTELTSGLSILCGGDRNEKVVRLQRRRCDQSRGDDALPHGQSI